jgi:PAS domain-containing protein
MLSSPSRTPDLRREGRRDRRRVRLTGTRDEAADRLVDALFAGAGVPLCLVAPDGTLRQANPVWLRAAGFSLDEAVGKKLVALFPDAAAAIRTL